MSWALIRNRSPYRNGSMVPSWFFAPQLGPNLMVSDVIEEADPRYFSMLDGGPLSGDELGRGRGYMYGVNNDRVTGQDVTFRCHPAQDGTINLMTLSPESVRNDLTQEMRNDLLDILGPLTEEEKTRHGL